MKAQYLLDKWDIELKILMKKLEFSTKSEGLSLEALMEEHDLIIEAKRLNSCICDLAEALIVKSTQIES